MKITSLDTYALSAPLPQVVRTSTHAISQVSEVIVTLTTDAGHVGIGEAHGPFLLRHSGAEGLRGVNNVLQAIRPLVLDRDPFDVEAIWQDLFALSYTSVRGIPTLARDQRLLITAMSAIDIAVWDLMGKAVGRPVNALLGGAVRRRIPCYVTGFYYRDGEQPDDVVREAVRYVEHGYRTLKVKVGGSRRRTTPRASDAFARRWAATSRSCSTPTRAGICRPRSARRNCAGSTACSGWKTRCRGSTSAARWPG